MSNLRDEVEYNGIDALVIDGSDESNELVDEEIGKTSIGKQLIANDLWTVANARKITATAKEWFKTSTPTFEQFCQAAKSLFLSGDLDVDLEPVKPVKQLTPQQQAWKEYREFSESHSSDECAARAKVDAGYASFRHKNLERESANTPVALYQVVGAKKPLTEGEIPPEVSSFAEAWKIMPTAQARGLLSAAVVGPIKAERNLRIFEEACRLGLL